MFPGFLLICHGPGALLCLQAFPQLSLSAGPQWSAPAWLWGGCEVWAVQPRGLLQSLINQSWGTHGPADLWGEDWEDRRGDKDIQGADIEAVSAHSFNQDSNTSWPATSLSSKYRLTSRLAVIGDPGEDLPRINTLGNQIVHVFFTESKSSQT